MREPVLSTLLCLHADLCPALYQTSWGFCSSSARSLWMMLCCLTAIPLNLVQTRDLVVLHFHPHWFPFWLPNCISTALLFLNIFLGLLALKSSGCEHVTSLCEDPWQKHPQLPQLMCFPYVFIVARVALCWPLGRPGELQPARTQGTNWSRQVLNEQGSEPGLGLTEVI